MKVTRRWFLEFTVLAGARVQSLARWAFAPLAVAALGACRSLLNTLRPPRRWVFPSIAGDFIIHTRYDPEKVDQFPFTVWAQLLQFPAVAATMLPTTTSQTWDPGAIDSDQVELVGTWVQLTAKPGTRLFREREIVRSDVLRMEPSGNFTISFSPQPLFPELKDFVPLTLDTVGPGRPCSGALDVAKLLSFDFCVRPEVCQQGPSSTLPTVTARWPQRLDLLVRPRGAAADRPLRLHREPALTLARADLAICGGPPRKLRWVEATYRLQQDLDLDIRAHPDGNETYVRIPAQMVTVHLRPGFVDLLIPDGSHLKTVGGRPAEAALAGSHLHSANRYAFAWISELPAETTTLPAETSSAFCLAGPGSAQWPLAPDPIAYSLGGVRVGFEVAASDVALCRITTWLAGKKISRSIEQSFKAMTLVLESNSDFTPRLKITPVQPAPPQSPKFVAHAVFDGDGHIVADKSTAAATGQILVVDLFTRVSVVDALDLRFKEIDGSCSSCLSSLLFEASDIAWAGYQGRSASTADWVHLRPTLGPPDAADYRAATAPLDKDAQILWQLDRNRFQIVTPRQVATPGPEPVAEMVALAPEAFRATLPTAFPITKEIWLPPFALREHRDFDVTLFKWQNPSNPNFQAAFKSLTMWEPRSNGQVDVQADSPKEVFTTFAGSEGGASVLPIYAGFAFNGALVPLRNRTWSPDATCHRAILAPYRAIAASQIRNVHGAIDVSPPDSPPAFPSPLQDCYDRAFDPTNPDKEIAKKRIASLNRAATDPDTELAYSPVGGTIGFNWRNEQQAIGLQELLLRGYLARYQRDYAIFSDLLLPYGIRINILSLTSRQDNGRLRFCTKWWFTEPSKSYGKNGNVTLDNLRPINSVNYNMNGPLLFKADIHFKSSADEWVDFDRTLQGIGLITAQNINTRDLAKPFLKQTVLIARPQALTLFHDTPMRLAHVEWSADQKSVGAEQPSCSSPPAKCGLDSPEITVTARGELEDVAGMSYDTRALEAVYISLIDPDSGRWCNQEKGDQLPKYLSSSLTLGDGVVRIDRPLRREDSFELNARAEHTLTKKITLADVGLLQLVLGSDDNEFLKNEGTLTIHERLLVHDKQQNGGSIRESKSDAEVDATLDFPEFTRGVSDVCSGSLSFRLKIVPRSFHASFTKTLAATPVFDALLKADIGVPGLLALKNCELHSHSGESVSFRPGDLTPCGDLLKRVFELLLDKLKGLLGFTGGGGGNASRQSPFDFQLLTNPFGFLVKLRLALPKIPLGAGSLEHLTFDLRLALAIDFSRSGTSAGSMMTFILGDYNFPGFGSLDWLRLPIEQVALGIFKQLRPPTLTITPFTVRFSVVIAVRVNPPESRDLTIPNPFRQVCFNAAACISGEGGLALAFDIGVANGSISITLGIVWCPHASYLFNVSPDPQNAARGGDEYFSFDEIALVARLELNASVLGVVSIFVRVEAMAQLKLTCDKSILTHLEVSGTAHIEILFATIDVSFTVDLDPLLGIDPNACQRVKAGPLHCFLRAPEELAREAAEEFFSIAEVAA